MESHAADGVLHCLGYQEKHRSTIPDGNSKVLIHVYRVQPSLCFLSQESEWDRVGQLYRSAQFLQHRQVCEAKAPPIKPEAYPLVPIKRLDHCLQAQRTSNQ
mmetsp:Transcript_4129/g.26079  ORF Transcript_4129/g.26079 Transcript_4129/m.26079 type:complete len:102 (+) Transcript_4129:3119-3424(+)